MTQEIQVAQRSAGEEYQGCGIQAAKLPGQSDLKL